MAIYHCSIKIHSRGKGQDAIATICYRAGDKIKSDRTGEISDYSHRKGVEYSEIMLPDYVQKTHPEFHDRATLWNAVDAAEKADNSQFSREWEVALPKELTVEQMKDVIRDFCSGLVDQGMIVDWSLHRPHDIKSLDTEVIESNNNWHCHISAPMRRMDEQGNWIQKEQKTYVLDKDGNRVPDVDPKTGRQKVRIRKGKGEEKLWKRETVANNGWNKKENVVLWRKQWEEAVNRGLEKAGRKERVDCRSLQDQGIDRIPQIHEGPSTRQIEKKADENPGLKVASLAVDKKELIEQFESSRQTLQVMHEISKAEHLEDEQHRADLEIRRADRAVHRIRTTGPTKHTLNILIKIKNTIADLMDRLIHALELEKERLQQKDAADMRREEEIRGRLRQLEARRRANGQTGADADGSREHAERKEGTAGAASVNDRTDKEVEKEVHHHRRHL